MVTNGYYVGYSRSHEGALSGFQLVISERSFCVHLASAGPLRILHSSHTYFTCVRSDGLIVWPTFVANITEALCDKKKLLLSRRSSEKLIN